MVWQGSTVVIVRTRAWLVSAANVVAIINADKMIFFMIGSFLFSANEICEAVRGNEAAPFELILNGGSCNSEVISIRHFILDIVFVSAFHRFQLELNGFRGRILGNYFNGISCSPAPGSIFFHNFQQLVGGGANRL